MNPNRIKSTRDLTTDQLRIETYATIAAVCRVGGLSAPQYVEMLQTRHHRCLSLKLGEDDRAGVKRWAEHVGIGPIVERRIGEGPCAFTAVQASRQSDEPGWLGWQWIDVWAACDRAAVTQ